MKLCFPVQDGASLDSPVYGHFGSAPAFLIVDSETLSYEYLVNAGRNHAPGMCNPIASLQGREIGAVIAGGIGAGALNKLHAAGIPVTKAAPVSVRENVLRYVEGSLQELRMNHVCGGHSEGCAH
jgi:predicted Fe-Mo cluster-binding NifX family protein